LYREYLSKYALAVKWSQVYIPLFFIGFCGGFTTFSTYVMDVYHLFWEGEFMRGWLLLALHLILGLAAAGAGIWLAWRIGSFIIS
ncbi:MAG: CrcB family protein, partial [Spirochaetota bacterium]